MNYADLGEFATGASETGRAGKLAVLALRARAALYWASPPLQPSNDQSRYTVAANYLQRVD